MNANKNNIPEKTKEEKDKFLLHLEIVVGALVIIFFISLCILVSATTFPDRLRLVIIFGGFVPSLIGLCYCTKIEQIAGYYECAKCHHYYVPTFKAVNLAPHMGRTRYMKCPECGEKSWQKKRIKKDV